METEVCDAVLVKEAQAQHNVAGRADRVEAVSAEVVVADTRGQRFLGQLHDDVELAVDRRHAVQFHDVGIRQSAQREEVGGRHARARVRVPAPSVA